MKINPILTCLFITLFLSGCFTSKVLILKDLSSESIKIPYKVENLNIVDKRDSLKSMNWDVPLLGGKKKEWIGNPILSETNKSEIEKIIMNSQSLDGIPINLEYRIIEGECKLVADWKSVTEFANFKAEINIEIPSKNISFNTDAVMNYENPTLNGTEKNTLRLYNAAVKNVTHLALKQVIEFELN